MTESTAHDIVCSVCIANYNGELLLDACLRSVLDQSFHAGVEIIVHDDASTDRSLDVLSRHPTVRLIASESNVGFCESNNRMVAASKGRYVLLLNNDAALHADALAVLLDAASAHPAPSILTLPQYDWDSGALVDQGCLLDPFMNPVPRIDEAGDVAMVIGACLWIPRTLWDEIGGFPTWMGSLAEDMYLCCAARITGHRVRCVPHSGYRHMQGKTFGGNRVKDGRLSSTYRRRGLSERNKTYLLAVFTPAPFLPWIMALHVMALVAEGAAMTLLRRSLRPWKEVYGAAIVAAWKHRGLLKLTRSYWQGRRRVTAARYYEVFRWSPRKLDMLRRHGVPDLR